MPYGFADALEKPVDHRPADYSDPPFLGGGWPGGTREMFPMITSCTVHYTATIRSYIGHMEEIDGEMFERSEDVTTTQEGHYTATIRRHSAEDPYNDPEYDDEGHPPGLLCIRAEDRDPGSPASAIFRLVPQGEYEGNAHVVNKYPTTDDETGETSQDSEEHDSPESRDWNGCGVIAWRYPLTDDQEPDDKGEGNERKGKIFIESGLAGTEEDIDWSDIDTGVPEVTLSHSPDDVVTGTPGTDSWSLYHIEQTYVVEIT